MNKSLMQDFNT
jgi:hypothetical protein